MPQRTGKMTSPRPEHLLAFALLTALPGCSGCTGTVAGKVTVGAAPATSGIVVFTSANGVPYSIPINANGSYRLTSLPVGDMKISVVNSMAPPGRGPVKDPDKPVSFTPNPLIPEKYAKADNGLKYTVHAGTQTNDIELSP